MYRAYSLRIDEGTFDRHLRNGRLIKDQNNVAARSGLDAFFDGDGSLLATKIMDNWFPKVKADVFISHSHKDEDLAIGLAGWLKDNLEISSFIDSCVWGYSDELLKKIDKRFCLQDDGYYSYSKRNRTTSHVNMMLATSLTKMIDQCECIIFLNTPNSISCKGCVEKDGTESPWIYSEIEATRLLRKNIPERKQAILKALREGVSIAAEAMSVRYDLDLKHLLPLDGDRISKWGRCGKRGADALDFLYDGI